MYMLEKAIYSFILVSSNHTYKVIIYTFYSNIAIKSKMPIARCNYNPTGTSIFAQTLDKRKDSWTINPCDIKNQKKTEKVLSANNRKGTR